MGGRWPYSCCFVRCCFQDLFNIPRSILVEFLSSFFSICLVSIHVVHPYSRLDTTAAWKKLCFILSDRSEFHIINNLSIAANVFASCIMMSFSVDRYCFQSTWICQLISENHQWVWRCLLFDKNTSTPFCLHSHGSQCSLLTEPDYIAGIRLR